MVKSTNIEMVMDIFLIAKNLNQLEPDRKHYFMEAGAFDGIKQSNSFKLEKIDWQGILIEPCEESFKKLLINRSECVKINCCLGAQNGPKLLKGTFLKGGLMATVKSNLKKRDSSSTKKDVISKIFRKFKINPMVREKYVPAKTFSEIIEETKYPKIDIFILDVEGYEIEVIKGIKKQHNPRILIVETRKNNSFEINDLMLDKGYSLKLNLSNFNKIDNPTWSADHQDYLWVLDNDINASKSVQKLSSLKKI
tara:strand:+ start:117 stop:872 length:756 start_codon:yes stop_codon:yes gene_type:complete